MVYLNTKAILDRASTKWQDQTPALREKSIAWLNEVVRDLHLQPRRWKFLEETIDLPITNNQVTLPTGFNEIVYLKGDNFFFTKDDQLTDEESDAIGQSTTDIPDGYVIDVNGLVTFYPGAIGTVTLKYEINSITDLPDSAADTIYPKDLENLFVTGVRMHYYDYDKDGRYGKEVQIYENEMYKVKCWDNANKATSKQGPYTRVR